MALDPGKVKQRERQIERLVRRFEQEVREAWGEEDSRETLADIEEQTRKLGEKVKKLYQKEKLDSESCGYDGAHSPCRCGWAARYKGDRVRRMVTLSGEVELTRSYYHCDRCREGFCPLDVTLDIGRKEYSCRVAALAGRVVSFLPHELASRELAALTGIRLSASTLRRMGLAMGSQIARDWSKREEDAFSSEPQLASKQTPQQLHGSMDGVFIHVDGDYKEVKLGVAFQAERESGVSHSNFYATLGDSSSFGRSMYTLIFGSGGDRCSKIAIVADGGRWIWTEVGKYFVDKVQILDFYHASEHLWEVARARFGKAAAAWVSLQQERLLENGIALVIADIAAWAAESDDDAKTKRTNLAYFTEHRARMKYKTLKAEGWHIGSGVQEASCRWVVQDRLKGVGMRWKTPGAEAILSLRTAWCSTDPTDLIDVATRAQHLPLS